MSDELIPNIIGFHANNHQKTRAFVDDGLLAYSDDTDYLGYGMYFWDNLSNARYWAGQKIKKEHLRYCYISSANVIVIDPVLDLTDKNTIGLIRRLWLEFCKLQGAEKSQPLGVILNTLYEYFDDTLGSMKVAKCIGSYEKWSKNTFLLELTNNYIDDRPKTIYTVKCDSKTRNHLDKETVSN